MPFTSEKSGESILKLSSPIKHLTVPISPVLYPASLKICRRKYAVEVFPFVPVTAANHHSVRRLPAEVVPHDGERQTRIFNEHITDLR